MHATTALLFALTGCALAAPAIEERETSSSFRLHVAGNEDLLGWAIVNAHVGAATNAIEIQRPAAYQSDVSKLVGTTKQLNNGKAKLQFNLEAAGTPYQLILPNIEHTGQIKQVFAEPGSGTNSFGLNGNNILTAGLDGASGFFACPTVVPEGDGKPFTLWYGPGAGEVDLPSSKCQSIKLRADPK